MKPARWACCSFLVLLLAVAMAAAAHGLANMQARALELGARLEIAESRPGVHVRLEFEPGRPVT